MLANEPAPVRLAVQPVVLDELDHRGLVGHVVADVVVPGPRGDDDQRQPGTVTAPVRGVADRDRGGRAHRRVGRGVRAVHPGRVLVVVPAVGVVIGDDDRGGLPVPGLLDLVDRVDDEVLLVDRIRVARVGVLVRSRLEVADGRHVAVLQRLVEVGQVVLVVGLIGAPDPGFRGRRQVLRVRGGLVVLERVVVRHVVRHLGTADVLVLRAADRVAGAVRPGRREPALEPAPGDVLRVEQVTDVLPGHHADRRGGRVAGVRAVVVRRVQVAVDGAQALAVQRADRTRVGGHRAGGRVDRVAVAVTAGGHVERAGRGRPEVRVVVVVAHRVVLRVVPQPGDGVAVVVVHDDAGRAVLTGAQVLLGVLDEHVHLAAVERFLLRRVAVVLVAGQRLGGGEPLRVVAVRVVLEQARRQAVHLRRARFGVEWRAIRVGRVRVGAEVVVEGLVLAEDHDEVLDRRAGRGDDAVLAGGRLRRDRDRVDGVRVGRARAGYRHTGGGAGDQDTGGEDGRVPAAPAEPGPADADAIAWAFAHVTLLSLGLIIGAVAANRGQCGTIAHNRAKAFGRVWPNGVGQFTGRQTSEQKCLCLTLLLNPQASRARPK